MGVTRSLVAMLARQIDRLVYLAPNGANLEIFKPFDSGQSSFLIAYVGGLSLRGYYDLLPLLLAIRGVRAKLGVDVKLAVTDPILMNSIRRSSKSLETNLCTWNCSTRKASLRCSQPFMSVSSRGSSILCTIMRCLLNSMSTSLQACP